MVKLSRPLSIMTHRSRNCRRFGHHVACRSTVQSTFRSNCTKMTSYVIYESFMSNYEVINFNMSDDSLYDVIFVVIGFFTWPGAPDSTFSIVMPTQRLRERIFKKMPTNLCSVKSFLFTLVHSKLNLCFFLVSTSSRTVRGLKPKWALESSRKT